MSRTRALRILVRLVLCTTLPGCAGYHPARTPWADGASNIEFDLDEDLAVGDKARVHLVRGGTVWGTVVEIGPRHLRLASLSDPDRTLTLAPEEIARVETKGGAKPAAIVVGAVVVVGVLTGVAVGLSNAHILFD